MLCNECFQRSNHQGHEVYFYHSAAGGCCDCGDSDAWCADGFCSQHGKNHVDPTIYLPPDIVTRAYDLFCIILDSIIEYCNKVGRYQSAFGLPITEEFSLVFYHDDFHNTTEFGSILNEIKSHLDGSIEEDDYAILYKKGFIRLKSGLSAATVSLLVPLIKNRGFTVRIMNRSDELCYEGVYTAVNWLQSLSIACDGMCRLIGRSITYTKLKEILDFDMLFDKQFSRSFHNLLLSLMADQPFKMCAGIAYTKSYKRLCNDYSKGQGLTGSTMFNLSVQFLNRETFVHEICYHHGFLQQAIEGLREIIASVNAAEATYFNQQTITHRRYGPIIGDLKVGSTSIAIHNESTLFFV